MFSVSTSSPSPERPVSPTTPELSALDLFVSVVNLGSLSKAARAHQIAQPSASSRIRSLERQLGVTLGVTALKARRAGRLRVAASFTIAEYLLPPLLEQFLRNRAQDSIKLDVANSSAVLSALEAGTADLGFIESPNPTPNMDDHVLAFDRLITVVGQNHPWARLNAVPLEALATTSLIVREPGSGTREALERALDDLGYEPPPSALEFGSTSAVRAAVMGGGPPAVISHRAAVADLDAGSLVEVGVPGLRIERRLRAVWPKGVDLPPLARHFLDQLPNPA